MIVSNGLLSLCHITTGKLDSNAAIEGGTYPFFTCSPQTLAINSFAFDTEAVLLAGNNASAIFPIKYYQGKFNAYQRTYVLESKDPNILDNRFLFYALQLQLQHLQNVSTGATTKFLTLGILKQIQIPLMPIKTQKQISFILTCYENILSANLRRIQLLEESARILYQEWFVRLRFPGHETVLATNGVPEGWDKKTLGDYVTLNYGKGLKETDRIDGDFPVYGSSGIVGHHNKPLISGPVIIVGRKGTVGSVYYSHCPCFPIDTVYFISSEQASYYLYLALQGFNFISSDAAVPGLNRNYAYSQQLLVPNAEIFSAFEANAQPVFEQINSLTTWNEKLRQARDMLLPKLMSGVLDVSRIVIPKEGEA